MSAGPILIFDKSLLEAISPDEAVWLGQFYLINITPLFFVETDLEKEGRQGRTPEQVVGRLAEKTSVMGAHANVHHLTLCVSDLLGNRFDMRRVPVMAGGRSVSQKGKSGLVFDRSPEAEAFARWQRREFDELERRQAKAWRNALSGLDLEETARRFKPIVERKQRPRSLRDIKGFVNWILNDHAQAERNLGAALQTLGVPYELWPGIFERWKAERRPTLPVFAPYAAHVFSVDLFFSLSLAAGMISTERPSNKIDMAYLYYLPFCMVFASMDKLHARTVPLFVTADQTFLWGADLKSELTRLDEHYWETLTDEEKVAVAHRPPLDGDFLTTRLWDQFMSPIWRKPKESELDAAEKAERHKALFEAMGQLRDAAPAEREVHVDTADFVVVESKVPTRMGKWQIVRPAPEDEPSGPV